MNKFCIYIYTNKSTMSLFQYVETREFQVQNPLFRVATNVTSGDDYDIGFFGQYYENETLKYTGLFRDASDAGKYKLFKGLETLPLVGDPNSVNNPTLADLDVNHLYAAGTFSAVSNATIGGNLTVDGNLLISGTTTTVNTETLLVKDNIIIANSGPANMKTDGGFVVKRLYSNFTDDSPKQSGLASGNSNSTDTILLSTSVGHSELSDYYNNWVIKIGNTRHVVTASSGGSPNTLTFTPTVNVPITSGTAYELYNKHYTGWIFDENTDKVTFYGFPREDGVSNIATDDAGGNLADYLDIQVNSLYAAGNANVVGDLNVNDIIASGDVSAVDVTASGNMSAVDVNATGNMSADGNISADGNVSGLDITATGNMSAVNVTATGNVTADGNISADGNVSGLDITANGNMSTVGLIASGNVTAVDVTATGNVNATGNVSGHDITANGNMSAVDVTATGNMSAENITANGNVTATGNVTAVDLNATGNVSVTGNLSLSGSLLAPLNIDDNIIAANVGPNINADDFGFVGKRLLANIANDTPKVSGVTLLQNYSANTTSLNISSTESGNGYFVGWVVTNPSNQPRRITQSTDNGGNDHTLTLESGWPTSLTAGTHTVNLFNQVYTGTIYDENTKTLSALSFPREMGVSNINPTAPINGNVPEYVNFAVKDLTVYGNFNTSGSINKTTKTVTADTSFTASDITNHEIIYLNKTSNGTYTLPTISSLSIPANTSYIVVFVNIHSTAQATLQGSGGNLIEGAASLSLSKQWMKVCLIASSESASNWMIKG